MSPASLAAQLAVAEERLRHAGLTGAEAFDALLQTIESRLGSSTASHPALQDLSFQPHSLDLLGLAYERFFPDLFKGKLGQYFTPHPIAALLLSKLPITDQTSVLDPTCGSGGLLLLAGKRTSCVQGFDIDPRLVQLARLNLRLRALPQRITRADFFTTTPEPVDVVVANPPFSLEITDPDTLRPFEIATGRRRVSSAELFLEAVEGWVRPGGWAALVVPWTLIANPTGAKIRARIDKKWVRRRLCRLPEGVFRPFGGAAGSAAALWLQRRPCDPGPMRYAEISDPGYDVRSKTLRETPGHDLKVLEQEAAWEVLDTWLPQRPPSSAPLSDWVTPHTKLSRFKGRFVTVDLADTNKRTGEVHPRRAQISGRRAQLQPREVLISGMRPELNNVAIVPDSHGLLGSPEWIRLTCEVPHFLMHALRSPAWRSQLPPTTGQTRPRTGLKTILQTSVRRPCASLTKRLDARSAAIHRKRQRLLGALEHLQHMLDRYQAGEIDEAELNDLLNNMENP